MKEPRIDIMVDLETLDTASTACVLSLGACVFDIYTGEIHNSYYAVISLQSNLALNRTISQSTFEWWMNQSSEAKDFINIKDKSSLQKALLWFGMYYKDSKATNIWSNGENFDIAILEHAYNSIKIDIPWKYNQARDTRTVWDMYIEKFGEFEKIPFEGIKHNAENDAQHQAKVLSIQFNKIIRG